MDIKINAPEILEKQLRRAAKGNIIMSSVTDPYQPVEAKFGLTRKCLEVLLPCQFPLDILTKSPLVLRDVDLLRQFKDIEIGVTITTNDDKIRNIFEPEAPSIESRIQTLKELHEQGMRTYAFIGPVLPMDPEELCGRIRNCADYVFIDRMNYTSKTVNIYKKLRLQQWLDKDFTENIVQRLEKGLSGKCNLCQV